MYVPWEKTPDETFLSPDIQMMLADKDGHKEIDSRYSLLRLEEFCKVYKCLFADGIVAPARSAWQHDNQYSYRPCSNSGHGRGKSQRHRAGRYKQLPTASSARKCRFLLALKCQRKDARGVLVIVIADILIVLIWLMSYSTPSLSRKHNRRSA